MTSLSNDEKRKIEEEEKVRAEARARSEKEAKKPKSFKLGGGRIGCLTLLIIGFVIIVVIAVSGGDEGQQTSTPSAQTGTSDTMAFVIAKGYVKDALKAPSTADFPFLDYQTTDLGDRRYSVSSHVDSENTFGAMIRTEWTATLRYLGGEDADPNSWELEELVMDGEVVYSTTTEGEPAE